jgi:hypothetical protein
MSSLLRNTVAHSACRQKSENRALLDLTDLTDTNRGLDPEITYQAPDILLRQELLRMPIPREFVVRLDVRP